MKEHSNKGYNLCFVGTKKQYVLPNIRCIHWLEYRQYIDMLESAAFVIVPLEEHPYSYGQMSLLGSLALGKYVIASKVSGISDYTEKCQSVISVKQHDVNEMYRAIKKYINENVKSKDRNIPRNEVENNFSEEQMGNKIKAFVFKVIQYGTNENTLSK